MKPAHVWTLFGLCLAGTLAAMGWSSAMVLRLERAQLETQAQAALEENARLALWRMDSSLTALVAQESARPYFQYSAYYPASSAYTDMFTPAQPEPDLVPSPLLRETPTPLVLHFQLGPGGSLTSPQVPRGTLRARALGARLASAALIDERAARLDTIRGSVRQAAFARDVEAAKAPPRAAVAPRPGPTPAASPLAQAAESVPSPVAASPVAQAAESSFLPTAESLLSQKRKNRQEYAARQQSLESNSAVLQQSFDSNQATRQQLFELSTPPKALGDADSHPLQPAVQAPRRARPVPVEEGTLAPLWLGDALVLVRRVRVNGTPYVQGCLLDWDGLQRELLASIQDLLPNARLERASVAPETDDERRLAALPARLVPGPATVAAVAWSPIRLSLAGAWLCLLLAAAAVAILLRGVLGLSERRRVFVSAVTHELRTPLTTFRLYTDMLAEGMVAEEKRGDYLGRLRAEAQRLGHLVENVLFYARLESGRGGAAQESFDLTPAVRDIVARLEPRARQAGLALAVDELAAPTPRVRADRSALEQILVNLVDNACKYAHATATPEIRVQVERSGRAALVRVRDHGPGLSRTERRRLFSPFSKSDRDAANSAPGVGLGLALSRRLARAQGGDLRLESSAHGGASFVLTLPQDGA